MNNIRVAVTPKHCRPCDVEQKLINTLPNPRFEWECQLNEKSDFAKTAFLLQ